MSGIIDATGAARGLSTNIRGGSVNNILRNGTFTFRIYDRLAPRTILDERGPLLPAGIRNRKIKRDVYTEAKV